MKKLFLIILFLSISVNCSAEIIGEITEIREVASGIINIKIEYKDGDKLLEEKTYTTADSPTAIASFQDNVLQKEMTAVIDKEASGGYDEAEIIPIVPEEKIYSIKVGDKVKNIQDFKQDSLTNDKTNQR